MSFRVGIAPLLLLGLWAGAAADGQLDPEAAKKMLTGERKFRYIARQLDLTDEQVQAYGEFIELVYQPTIDREIAAMPQRLEKLKDLIRQREEAQKSGDEQRLAAIEKELNTVNPSAIADAEFYEAIKQQLLTPEQIERLKRVRARLFYNRSGELTPGDVLQTVRELELDDEQIRKLDTVMKTFRDQVKLGGGRLSEPRRIAVREKLVQETRELLTPEQQEVFDKRIDAMRVKPAPNQRQS